MMHSNFNKLMLLIVGTMFLVITCKKPEPEVAASLTVNPASKNVEASPAGNFTIEITSTVAWTASTSDNWITLTPTKGTGNGTTTADYQVNTATTARTATVTIKGTGVADKTVTITQAATVLTKPTAATQAASNITKLSATLKGNVNANGQSTTVSFDYGLTTTYDKTAPATQSPVTGNATTNVSADITGLTANTEYH